MSDPLRIGVNALYLIPGGVGGTEIYLRSLLPALAKMGVELRPSALGKGDVVMRLGRGAGAAVYAGDDLGDVPAFVALRRLPAPSVSVAVLGRETPRELVRAADVVCPSPFDWVNWLREMATS